MQLARFADVKRGSCCSSRHIWRQRGPAKWR